MLAGLLRRTLFWRLRMPTVVPSTCGSGAGRSPVLDCSSPRQSPPVIETHRGRVFSDGGLGAGVESQLEPRGALTGDTAELLGGAACPLTANSPSSSPASELVTSRPQSTSFVNTSR